ncbi:ABC transporter permease [Micromonospora krabiensis]|uniref:ABC-2 type transport system permease protein n=1 Tax=Micromonospora krabiensis TaxID=307121 RepID=A0A1C3N7Y7_9ACTN|nr:ABC transporter permease [Micromonospora krabiensis]SBV28695.1 ABC-2 type transport system permease protein [Micromonospora krabiensis]
MRAYLRFELRRLARDPRVALFSVLGPVVTYLIFSGLLGGDDRLEGVDAAAALMVGLAGYGAVAGVLSVGSQVAQERAVGWLHQLRVTPLPPRRVVAAKALVCTLSGVPSVIAVGVAGWIQHHIELGAGRWIALLLLMWAGTVPFALLGLAIGYGLAPQLAQPVNFLVFLGLSVLGGLLVPVAYFPSVLRPLAHALPTYRYAELGWRSVAGQAPTPSGLGVLMAWTVTFAAVAAWAYRRSTARR